MQLKVTVELHRHRPRVQAKISLPPAAAVEEIELSEDDNDFAKQQEQVLVASSHVLEQAQFTALSGCATQNGDPSKDDSGAAGIVMALVYSLQLLLAAAFL